MKTWEKVVLLSLLVLFLCSCGIRGRINKVERIIQSNESCTAAEIERAMRVVEQHFWKHFRGCTLLELEYDEARTGNQAAAWAARYGVDRTIVLLSSFEVGSRSDGSLEPNSTYRNWQWILTQTDGEWVLQTWGYG